MQLTQDELRTDMWFSTDKNGRNVWYLATEGGHFDTLKKLLAWANELQLKDEELINAVTNRGRKY
jgi:hypothetical protein